MSKVTYWAIELWTAKNAPTEPKTWHTWVPKWPFNLDRKFGNPSIRKVDSAILRKIEVTTKKIKRSLPIFSLKFRKAEANKGRKIRKVHLPYFYRKIPCHYLENSSWNDSQITFPTMVRWKLQVVPIRSFELENKENDGEALIQLAQVHRQWLPNQNMKLLQIKVQQFQLPVGAPLPFSFLILPFIPLWVKLKPREIRNFGCICNVGRRGQVIPYSKSQNRSNFLIDLNL